jgi:inosine-uridine nucleoside N-ribohydrolase
MTTRRVFVDTDIGLGTPGAEIDDGAALRVLLRAPQVEVCALGTVHGNVSVEVATHNARRLLAYEGRADIPVGRGAALPLVEDPRWFAAWQAGYGPTEPWPGGAPRPGGDELPAADRLLIDMVRRYPHQMSLLALGPLTNLAQAIQREPDIVPLVREVVVMGGSYDSTAQTAEFNFRSDPDAAAVVVQAGWPLRLLGLEVTRRVHFSRARFASLPDSPPALGLLKRQAPGWIDRIEGQGWDSGGCSLHDAVAAAALLDEALCSYVETGVSVELTDPARRGLVAFGPPTRGARVAATIEAARCRDLIWALLTG